jgi:hypothetical protein
MGEPMASTGRIFVVAGTPAVSAGSIQADAQHLNLDDGRYDRRVSEHGAHRR